MADELLFISRDIYLHTTLLCYALGCRRPSLRFRYGCRSLLSIRFHHATLPADVGLPSPCRFSSALSLSAIKGHFAIAAVMMLPLFHEMSLLFC